MACKCGIECKGNCSKITLDQLMTRLMGQLSKPVLLIAKTPAQKAELWPNLIAEAIKLPECYPLIGTVAINYWQKSIVINEQISLILVDALEYLERPNTSEFDIVTYGIPSQAFAPFVGGNSLIELNHKPQTFYKIPVIAPEQEANTLAVVYVPGYSEVMYLDIARLNAILGEGVAESARDLLVGLFNLAPIEPKADVKLEKSPEIFPDFAIRFK